MTALTENLGIDESTAATAARVHDQAIVIDGSTVAIVNPWLDVAISQSFFEKMIVGGVTATNVTVPQDVDQGLTAAIRELNAHRAWIEQAPAKALLVRSVSDVARAKSQGRAGIIFGPQNSNLLDESLAAIEIVHNLGIRVMQLTYNRRNAIGDGCYEKNDAGLSNFGREAVKEMNETGIAVDLSHCGDRTTTEAIQSSDQPVIFSHANSKAVFEHPRNKTDDHLRALAERGGVICLMPYTPFLADGADTVPSHKDFLRHVDHVADLVGVDHIGVATDINDNNETRRIGYRQEHPEVVGIPQYHRYPVGFDGDLRNFRFLTGALLSGGYSEEQVCQMLGGNLLRVLGKAWKS